MTFRLAQISAQLIEFALNRPARFRFRRAQPVTRKFQPNYKEARSWP